ncbi:3-oxoadipate enol-lactone hydrolase, partial [Bisporella sp. PMI_857]
MPFIKVNDKKLYYVHQKAKGTPKYTLVLIHGLGSSSSFYFSIIPRLVAAGYSCLALDTYGSGLSKYTGLKQSVETISQDVIQLLKELNISSEESIVIGHSMGGIVATQLASQYDFKGTVLLGPVRPNPGAASVFAQRIETVEKGGMETMADTIPLAATGTKSNSTHHAFIRALLLSQEAAGYSSLCRVIAEAQLPDYAGVTCPVLILAGSDDKSAPLDGAQKILDDYGSTRKQLIKLDGVGHWHCVEAAGEVGEHIESF